jgi:hypothetical protein
MIAPGDARGGAWVIENIHSTPLWGLSQGQFSFAQRYVLVYLPGPTPGTYYKSTSNVVAVAYYDPSQTALVYAKRVNGVWQSEIVESNSTVGRNPALALDSSGRARITYLNANTKRIRYARQLPASETSVSCGLPAKNWRCIDVPNTYGPYATYNATGLSAVRLDSSGTIHIAYAASEGLNGYDLLYVTRGDTAAEWNPLYPVRTTISVPGFFGELRFKPTFLALELDGSGKPQIGVRQAGSPLYWLHDKSFSYWGHEEAAPSSSTSANEKQEHHGMVLGSDGLPRFVYTEEGNLKMARRTSSGSWSHSTVHASVGSVPCSIDLNPSNYARISYFRGVPQLKLQLASWYYNANPNPYAIGFSGWAESTVDTGPDVAVRNQVVVTSDDKPLLVYYDAYTGFFKFAEWK